jgi:hypothetical protein
VRVIIHCECGRDIDITNQLDADLRLIADHQAAEIERLKEAIRVRGGCRMLSDGDKCDCGLCVRDNEIERLRERIQQHEAGMDSAGLSWMRSCDELTAECFRHKAEIERLRGAVAYLREKAVQTHGPDPYVYVWQRVWEEFERRVSE